MGSSLENQGNLFPKNLIRLNQTFSSTFTSDTVPKVCTNEQVCFVFIAYEKIHFIHIYQYPVSLFRNKCIIVNGLFNKTQK